MTNELDALKELTEAQPDAGCIDRKMMARLVARLRKLPLEHLEFFFAQLGLRRIRDLWYADAGRVTALLARFEAGLSDGPAPVDSSS